MKIILISIQLLPLVHNKIYLQFIYKIVTLMRFGGKHYLLTQNMIFLLNCNYTLYNIQ